MICDYLRLKERKSCFGPNSAIIPAPSLLIPKFWCPVESWDDPNPIGSDPEMIRIPETLRDENGTQLYVRGSS